MQPPPPPSPLRDDLVIQHHPGSDRRDGYYVIKDPRSRAFFKLSEEAHRVALLLDGRRPTVRLAALASEGQAQPFSVEEVAELVEALADRGMLRGAAPPGWRSPREVRARQQSLVHLRLPLFDPDRLLTWLARRVGWLVSAPFALLAGLLALAGGALAALHPEPVLAAMDNASRGTGPLLAYGLATLTLTAHELAHGLTCKRLGGEVHEMGFLLLWFIPCAYTDVSDAYLLTSRRQRVAVSLAGPVSDLFIFGCAACALVLLRPGPGPAGLLGALVWITGINAAMINLNPMIRMDGYYALVDLLELPNLRGRALDQVASLLPGREPAGDGGDARQTRTLLIYGWLSLLYLAVMLPIGAYFVDGALVARLGPWGRLLYAALAVVALVSRVLRRRRT